MVCVVVEGHPFVDVTTSVTVYVPEAVNVCDGLSNEELLLPAEAGSPKSHRIVEIVSVDGMVDVLVKFTVCPPHTWL